MKLLMTIPPTVRLRRPTYYLVGHDNDRTAPDPDCLYEALLISDYRAMKTACRIGRLETMTKMIAGIVVSVFLVEFVLMVLGQLGIIDQLKNNVVYLSVIVCLSCLLELSLTILRMRATVDDKSITIHTQDIDADDLRKQYGEDGWSILADAAERGVFRLALREITREIEAADSRHRDPAA